MGPLLNALRNTALIALFHLGAPPLLVKYLEYDWTLNERPRP